MRVIFAFIIIAAAAAAVPTEQQRIVGGTVTSIATYPDLVSLLMLSGNTFSQECGGVIVNNRAFLSAAHCFVEYPYANWRGRVGSTYANSGGFVYDVAQIIIHPNYNSYTEDSDIAVLRVFGAITFTTLVTPARLAGPNYVLYDNQVIWGAGWGVTYFGGVKSEQLRHVQIWTINQQICAQRYASHGQVITNNMLCAGYLNVGGRDMCTGDSGGPLYHNRVVVGISSFGIGCGNPNYPGVNARVSHFSTWASSIAQAV